MHIHHFGKKKGRSVTNGRLVENVVHLSLVLLNGGRNTRIPDVPSHTATATARSLVSPDLAVNSSLETKNDPLGNGHLPVVIYRMKNLII